MTQEGVGASVVPVVLPFALRTRPLLTWLFLKIRILGVSVAEEHK